MPRPQNDSSDEDDWLTPMPEPQSAEQAELAIQGDGCILQTSSKDTLQAQELLDESAGLRMQLEDLRETQKHIDAEHQVELEKLRTMLEYSDVLPFTSAIRCLFCGAPPAAEQNCECFVDP